jgi:hypothetical protein
MIVLLWLLLLGASLISILDPEITARETLLTCCLSAFGLFTAVYFRRELFIKDLTIEILASRHVMTKKMIEGLSAAWLATGARKLQVENLLKISEKENN